MRSFFRSLRYLKPYKTRLAFSFIFVLLIAVLWGGGLGMAAPVLKVIFDPEGLHGWAWRAATEDRLGIKLVRLTEAWVQGKPQPSVLNVIDVEPGGPAGKSGIKKNDWIVAVRTDSLAGGEGMLRNLALAGPGSTARLSMYNQGTGKTEEVAVQLGPEKSGSRLLVYVASRIHEPADMPGRIVLLLWILGIMLAISLVRNVCRFAQEYLVQTAVWRAMMDLRMDNYNVALRLPLTFYSSKGASDTMSRFVQDTHQIHRGQVALFAKTMVEPAKAIGATTMALLLSWKLTLAVMIVGPPTYVLIRRFGKTMKRASRKALESWSKMLAVLEETLVGIRVVKAYTMESAERKRFFRINRNLLKEQDRISRVDSATAPSVEAMGIAAGIVAAGTAGYFVLQGAMDPYVFMAWMACLAAMFDPLRKLAEVVNRFHSADAAAIRTFELSDQPQEKRVAKAPLLPPHKETIEFRNVTFRYPEASVDALKDINVKIRAGETVAIVGPNGSGKTTLVSLLPRLLDPTAGKVLIDGQDILEVSLRSLRRQIGVVTQDAVVFNATIAENISYGLRRARREAVLAAAKKAFVDEFVGDLPEGYETMVGEHGATLSGGQKQRITIARAFLRNPRILIFDEALSQADADSERKIHQAMEEFVKGRTTLMIAHRFATVLSADRIVVMDAGRIIDSGTHEEMLERCEIYRHLYRTQFVATGGK